MLILLCLIKYASKMNLRIVFSTLTILLISVLPAASQQETHQQQFEHWIEHLDEQMQQMIEKDHVPNAVIAVVADDEIVFLKGYGFAEWESKEQVDPEKHLFRVGSVSKVFTWTALMQLYEQGKINLDDDINRYLDFEPRYPKHYIGESQPITIAHLMSHTAGFEDVMQGLFSFSEQPLLRDYVIQHQPARIFPPGEVMGYSNYGTSLAGYIVERVSGMPFEDYIKENVFEPLGMYHSTFRQPLPQELAPRMVTAYRWINDEYHPGNFEFMPVPAGALSLTATDMARFIQAGLNSGENEYGVLLKPETHAQMVSPLKVYNPLVAGMAHGYMHGMMNGQTVIQHGGSTSIFDAGLYLLPDINAGIFIAYSGGKYSGHIGIMRDFMDTFFEEEDSDPIPLTPMAFDPKLNFEGEYHQSRALLSGSDRLLNLIIGSLTLKQEDPGKLKFRLYDNDFSFTEVTPGIYRSDLVNKGYPFGPVNYLLFTQAPDDRPMLVTDGPMTFIKARWYETSTTGALVFIPMLIMAILAILVFIGRLIFIAVKRNNSKKISTTVKYIFAHAVTLIVTIMVMVLNSEPDPVHLLPASFFNPDPLMDALMKILPVILVLLAFFMFGALFKSYRVHSGKILSRIFMSLYALWGFAFAIFLWIYNFLPF